MPALPPYMPAKDADFTNWLNNFSTLISANAPAYGLMTSDADTIAAQNAAWAAAYGPVTSKATRTADAVSAKDVARVTVSALIRTYAQNIANNPGVTVNNKIALGLNPKTSTPSPITAPTTYPNLSLSGVAPLTATIYYRDSAASTSVKAKPYGVTQCRVYGMASATPITDKSLLPLVATPTKSPFVLNFASADVGMKFYAAARWATRTGLLGPWSTMLSFTVMDG